MRCYKIEYREYYKIIDCGDGYKTKQLVINLGKKISLQFHNTIAQHWVVVVGNAKVILDGEVRMVGVNESLNVPTGVRRRIENVNSTALRLIEVQSGKYLGEDDIVRIG